MTQPIMNDELAILKPINCAQRGGMLYAMMSFKQS